MNKANRRCSLDKQKKTPERQSLMNSHRLSPLIKLDVEFESERVYRGYEEWFVDKRAGH